MFLASLNSLTFRNVFDWLQSSLQSDKNPAHPASELHQDESKQAIWAHLQADHQKVAHDKLPDQNTDERLL